MIYVFGAPWHDRVLRPGSAVEQCPTPEGELCRVCGEGFTEADKGIVTLLYVVDLRPGEMIATGRREVLAAHRECMFWKHEGHDAGYCHCDWPDVPTRALAQALWRSACSIWN